MTVCNMSIEGGARAGLIAPDETTYDYLRGRPQVPQGAEFDKAVERWRKLPTDAGAKYDKSLVFDGDRNRAASHLGHQSRPGRPGDRPRAQARPSSPIPTSRRRPPARSTTWASPAASRSAT